MGIGLLDPGSPGHDLAAEASSILGIDLVGLACEGDSDAIRATDVAQPLLLLHSVAVLLQLPAEVRSGVVAVAGHSLGEYTGLVATGALEWQEALTLVRERGLAMAAAASPGQGMSAVLAMDGPRVSEVLAELGRTDVVVANINAPGQVVLSGQTEGLDAAAEALRAAGARKVIPLSVGGPSTRP
jgi:[acyl-carrier-protein] S-malonyltransferase